MADINLPTDGTTDIGPLVQNAYDAGAEVIQLLPHVTYYWNTAVFLDKTNAYGGIVIEGNKAIVKLGPGLPTSNWPRDSGTRFAIFPNTKRAALVAGVVTVNDTNRATGSTANLRALIVRDVTIDGQGNNNRGFAFANRTSCTFQNVVSYQLRVCHTWHSYTDGNVYDTCYLRGVSMVADTSWFVEQYTSGDGVVIISPKSDAGSGFANLKTCRGAVISGAVTAKLQFDNCSGIVIEGGHFEGQQATESQIVLSSSQVTLIGTVIYENWSNSVSPIIIDDTNSDRGSELVLNQCIAQQLYTASESSNIEFSALINITAATGTTRVVSRDLKGMLTSTGMAGIWADAGQPRIKATDANIQAAIDSSRGRAALATGNFHLHQNVPGSWVMETIAPQVYASIRQSGAPSIDQVLVSTGMTNGGTMVNGQQYQYCVAVIDALGNYSLVSAAVAGTVNTSAMTRVLVSVDDIPGTIVIWRKTGTGVLTGPDRYAIIPARSARTYLYDTGNFIGGRPWIIAPAFIPVPNTVAGANTTVAALIVNGKEVVLEP